jgi:hypothetical protein
MSTQVISDYLHESGFDSVTVAGTYEELEFQCPDRMTALGVRHFLAGDVEFAGGIAVTKQGSYTLYGSGN